MTREIARGTVVLASDPFGDGRRPMLIISDETYPFFPSGFLGLPITSQDKRNTFQIHDHDTVATKEALKVSPSYVNPWSPNQVNDPGRKLVKLSDTFCDTLAGVVAKSVGVGR